MRLVVGAPVAERGWILPRWWQCLEQQTLQPDAYCFVYSDSQDDTLEQLMRPHQPVRVQETSLPFYSRAERNTNPRDRHRAEHFAGLRNQLRTLFIESGAEICVSLDTDVLLEDPTALERLVGYVAPRGPLPLRWDVVSPRLCLHPHGEASHCYNAAWLGGGKGMTQVWQRADIDTLSCPPPVKIDMPMACVVARRQVWNACAYQPHECGEDIGWAQQVKLHRFRVGWCHDIVVRHVWDRSQLEVPAHV